MNPLFGEKSPALMPKTVHHEQQTQELKAARKQLKAKLIAETDVLKLKLFKEEVIAKSLYRVVRAAAESKSFDVRMKRYHLEDTQPLKRSIIITSEYAAYKDLLHKEWVYNGIMKLCNKHKFASDEFYPELHKQDAKDWSRTSRHSKVSIQSEMHRMWRAAQEANWRAMSDYRSKISTNERKLVQL